jgi:hypothetical protein
MSPGLAGRGRLLFFVGMVDGDGGIDIQMQPPTGASSPARGQIGEHRTRLIDPWAPIGIGQRGSHPRRDTLHLRSAFPPALRNLREVTLCLAGQALSHIYTPAQRQFDE